MPIGRPGRRGTPASFIVIGLGNPGPEFAGTRHNVGFDVVSELCRRHGAKLTKTKQRSLVAEVRDGGSLVVLAQPQTYMNDSGTAAQLLVRRFGLDSIDRLVIVHDELDLPLGRMKLKVGGGLAGHNGLRSLRDHLQTSDFARVRIGIGKPRSAEHGADHVLSRVPKAERALVGEMVQLGADAVDAIIDDGLASAMARYNGVDLSGDG